MIISSLVVICFKCRSTLMNTENKYFLKDSYQNQNIISKFTS